MTVSEVIALLVKHGCEDVSIHIDRSGWNDSRGGGFGDVYKARFLDGTKVAIKTPIIAGELGVDQMNGLLKKAARELHTWHKCQHPNVLKLLGVAEFRGKVGMVSRWATNGTLREYVLDNPGANRCNLSTQVCDGLAYLHAHGTVHGDLKANNVVVSETGVPLITDFGHAFLGACTLPITTTSHSAIGTLRWTAPEILKKEAKRSFSGDIYSLGMTILETLTGEVPYSDVDDIPLYALIVRQGRFPTRPETYIPRNLSGNMLWSLLESCWSRKVQARPSAAEVRDIMKGFTPEKLQYVAYL